MEIVIPYMLIILGWHPDTPGEVDLQRPEIVFVTQAGCEAAGAEMADSMTEAAAGEDGSGTRYEFRCLATPSYEEYDRAFAAEGWNE